MRCKDTVRGCGARICSSYSERNLGRRGEGIACSSSERRPTAAPRHCGHVYERRLCGPFPGVNCDSPFTPHDPSPPLLRRKVTASQIEPRASAVNGQNAQEEAWVLLEL